MRADVVASYVSSFGMAFEVGVGYYWKIAELLKKKGCLVGVCDIKDLREEARKRCIDFYLCDITDLNLDCTKNIINTLKEKVDVIYSIRPPPEIWNCILKLAKVCKCSCIIRPMYTDYMDRERKDLKLVNYHGEVFYTKE